MKKIILLGSIILSGLLLQAQKLPGKFHSNRIGNTFGGKHAILQVIFITGSSGGYLFYDTASR